MIEHLPVLLIVVPLASAPLCVLARRRAPAMGIALAASWAVLAMAIGLLLRVLQHGTVSYALGDWPVPWGIEYRVDVLGAFVLTLISGVGAVVFSAAPRSIDREIPRDQHYLFCAVYLLSLSGLLGITVTGDLFNLFVFLEISALSSYAMISLGPHRRARLAAFNYLVLGTIGATFILIGIGLMLMMTGTLNMADMADRLLAVHGLRTVRVAFAFLTVGIGIKMALFPLHLWLPDAYTQAPSVVSAFLAASSTKVAVYVLLRFVFTVYGSEFAFDAMSLDAVLLPLALLAIVVASVVAIFQSNVKRMLAYSSIAQIGYMALGISFASVTGLTAGIVHVFNHALMKGGLFLAMACVALRAGSVDLERMAGLGRRMPWTMAAWVVGGLGLIGVPLTAGFISKVYLIGAAMERGWWPVAVFVLLSSLLALVYVWRVIEVAYFRLPPQDAPPAAEAPLALLLPTWVLIGASLYFGLFTSWSAGIARLAARALLGLTP